MIAQGRRVITEAMVAEIEALAPRYPNRRALVLPALHIVNRELRHVPLDAVVDIAAVLGLPPAEVQDTLTFYQFFHQDKPHGKVRAFVCRSISCALRGGDELLERLCHANGIPPYGTTPMANSRSNRPNASGRATSRRASSPTTICSRT